MKPWLSALMLELTAQAGWAGGQADALPVGWIDPSVSLWAAGAALAGLGMHWGTTKSKVADVADRAEEAKRLAVEALKEATQNKLAQANLKTDLANLKTDLLEAQQKRLDKMGDDINQELSRLEAKLDRLLERE